MTVHLASKSWAAPSRPFWAGPRRRWSKPCTPRHSTDAGKGPRRPTSSGRMLSRFRLVISASIGIGLAVAMISAYLSHAVDASTIHSAFTVRALSLLATLAFVGVWDRIVRVMKG